MAARGIAQNLKKEENVTVARVGAKSVQTSLGQATSQGLLAGSSKTTVTFQGSKLTWIVSFAKERKT